MQAPCHFGAFKIPPIFALTPYSHCCIFQLVIPRSQVNQQPNPCPSGINDEKGFAKVDQVKPPKGL